MIVSRRDGELVLVRQVDHQLQCRVMADAWGNGQFERLPHWASLVTAAAVHDEGWRAWEESPQLDPSGRPEDFIDVDRAIHVDIYRHGIEHALGLDPRAGLIVSMHGRGLYEARLGLDGDAPDRGGMRPEVQRFLEEQDELAARLTPELGPVAELWDAYRLLQAWDLLSLYVVWRALPAGRSGELPQVPRRSGDPGVGIRLRPGGADTVVLDPYPFAESPVALPVEARVIADRDYGDPAALGDAIERARPRPLEIVARSG